ncbi:iron hydrogenase [Vairimorpha necatrix]|uniref:Iron hydrogenase n=1 Tax=Vairimorpha necatrix TaxID=6039 RepID=A0AAX4JB90_9MICR
MKSENKPCVSPFTFKLEDCLACSSCISDFTVKKPPTYNELKNDPLTFLISPHSKMSIYEHYITNLDNTFVETVSTCSNNINNRYIVFNDFEYLLVSFLKLKFNIVSIYDSSYIKSLLYESVYEESLTNNLIISDCPGTVTYIEKQAHHLLPYLSKTKTQQQVLLDFIKGKCISVVQCYDKMLEKDLNTSDTNNLDVDTNNLDVSFMTTYDFYKMIVEQGFFEYKDKIGIVNEWEKCNIKYHYGYLDYILHKKYYLNKNEELILDKNQSCKNKQIKNKFNEIKINGKRKLNINSEVLNNINIPGLEYTAKNGVFLYTWKSGNITKKYIRILGLEPFLNFIKETKIKGMNYEICEIYICNQGCINGPGQIYTENNINRDVYKNNSNNSSLLNSLLVGNLKTRTFKKIKSKTVKFQVDW